MIIEKCYNENSLLLIGSEVCTFNTGDICSKPCIACHDCSDALLGMYFTDNLCVVPVAEWGGPDTGRAAGDGSTAAAAN